MKSISLKNSRPENTDSKAWGLVVAGYSMAALALIAFLTINGESGIPTDAVIGIAGLILIRLFLPATGILQMRKRLDPTQNAARHGLAMQTVGIFGLLFGVLLVAVTSSLLGYFLSTVFVVLAGALSIAGAVLLRKYFALNNRGIKSLIIGTALIFVGVGLIAVSNIAFDYLISQMENTIYSDIGATVSACGCVLTAYFFFLLRKRS